MSDEQIKITKEEAIALLDEGESIHTFINPGAGILLGADWSRSDVLKAIDEAEELHVTGEQAQRMGHGLAIKERDRFVFVETKEAK